MLNLDTHILIHALRGSLTGKERRILSSDTARLIPKAFYDEPHRQHQLTQPERRQHRKDNGMAKEWHCHPRDLQHDSDQSKAGEDTRNQCEPVEPCVTIRLEPLPSRLLSSCPTLRWRVGNGRQVRP
jgi:hypothetical protein